MAKACGNIHYERQLFAPLLKVPAIPFRLDLKQAHCTFAIREVVFNPIDFLRAKRHFLHHITRQAIAAAAYPVRFG